MIVINYPKEVNSFNSRMNDSVFIDRLFSLFIEDGIHDINYGQFIAKIYSVGMVKVLKSLGLYKTIGRGSDKKVTIDPRLKVVIDTTILDNEDIGKNIISLGMGHYNGTKFNFSVTKEYLSIKESKAKREIGNFGTYIMFNPNSMLYKIGRSKNVFNRVIKLRYEFGEHIEIVAVCEKDYESELHFKYRHKREFGEWFSITIDDVLDIFSSHKFVSIKSEL